NAVLQWRHRPEPGRYGPERVVPGQHHRDKTAADLYAVLVAPCAALTRCTCSRVTPGPGKSPCGFEDHAVGPSDTVGPRETAREWPGRAAPAQDRHSLNASARPGP